MELAVVIPGSEEDSDAVFGAAEALLFPAPCDIDHDDSLSPGSLCQPVLYSNSCSTCHSTMHSDQGLPRPHLALE